MQLCRMKTKKTKKKNRQQLRPVPLGGICEEEKVHMGGHSPQEGSRLTHSPSIPDLGSYMEETSPLAC